MPRVTEELLLQLLQACAARVPEPLYPARFASEQNLDRDTLDVGLEELRRRGLLKLTDWVKDFGQGYALTEAGRQALERKRLPTGRAEVPDRPAGRPLTDYERGEMVRASIFDPTTPYVSRVLLTVNLLFFLFGAFYAWSNELDVGDYLAGNSTAPTFTTNKILLKLGAVHPLAVFIPDRVDRDYSPRPQFERIILFFFLHIGLFHLFMNMYFLYSLGPMIESMWGSLRFLAIYFIAGIVSGCVILLFALAQERSAITAGASGCLFGIFMAMVVWFYLNRQYLPERLIQDWSRNLGTNAVLLIAVNFLPGVSWQGHLGGAIGGLLAALVLHVQRYHPSAIVRVLALAGLPIIPIGFFVAVLWQAGYF